MVRPGLTEMKMRGSEEREYFLYMQWNDSQSSRNLPRDKPFLMASLVGLADASIASRGVLVT